jgi:hypothetical protein
VCCAEADQRPDRAPSRIGLAWLMLLALLGAGCGQVPAPPDSASPAPGASAARGAGMAGGGGAGASAVPPLAALQPSGAAGLRRRTRPADPWDDYRQQAAERIVALNQASTYAGPVPEPLLAIPVLEIELNADGSVRDIHVKRQPGQALDTVQLAIDAVQRAAPFGDVRHLPRPWKFVEVFLFDDQRRFKPRSLDF